MSYFPFKIGMPTLIECPTLEKNFALCKRQKLDFVEINMNLPQYQLDRLDIGQMKDLIEETGISVTFHLEERLGVFDFNKAVAKSYLDTVLQTIEIAKILRAPILNMHLDEGIHVTLPERKVYLYHEYDDEYLKRLETFRDAVERAIGIADVTICIENTDRFRPFQQRAIDFLLESDCFGLTLDIGHDYLTGHRDGRFISSRRSQLRHLHIHDATREKCHLPLGEGRLHFGGYFRTAGETQSSCVLEVKTIAGLRKSIRFLKEHLDSWREMTG